MVVVVVVVVAEDMWKRKGRANVADIAAADTWNTLAELDAPTDEGYAMHETVSAPEESNVDLTLDIDRAMLALSDQQRRVIRGVFNDEPTTDVAVAVGVSPSRITRIGIAASVTLAADLRIYRTA